MAFAKKPKLCVDGPAGFQQINGLADNLESLKDELELEHAELILETDGTVDILGGDLGFGGADIPASEGILHPGAHNSALIPRGVAFVKAVVGANGIASLSLYAAAGCLTGFDAIDTGTYFFPVLGFSSVWGRVTPWGSAGTPVLDARVNAYVGDEILGTGLLVKTFMEQASGSGTALLAYDAGFYVVCFGRR